MSAGPGEARGDKADWYRRGYWREEPLWSTLERAAASAPDARVSDDVESITIAELLLRARRAAAALTNAGIRPADAVIIQSRNSIEAFAATLSCFAAGFVAVPLPPIFSSAQVEAVASNVGARALIQLDEKAADRLHDMRAALPNFAAIFVDDRLADGILLLPWWRCTRGEPHPPGPRHPDDDALVLYSSGSTGTPKGVVHSANSLRFSIEALARFHGVGARDVVLVALEFGFVGGTILGALLALCAGASVVLMRSWNPDAALAAIERHRVSYTLLMPTHVYDVMSAPALDRTDCRSLIRGILAGIPEHMREDAARRFCARPLPMFGMSESIGHVTCAPDDPWNSLMRTDGRALPGVEISIRDADGNEARRGTVGDLFLRGPNRLLRYLGNPALSAETILDGGWFRTGDRASLDDDAFMLFVGRAKEIIRRGGVTIVPGDVEIALLKHPLIAEAAVVPVPDPRLGEKACACIVPRGGASVDLADIARHLEAEKMARYLWPEHLLVFESLPRTASLKVRRADLEAEARRLLAQGSTRDAHTASRG